MFLNVDTWAAVKAVTKYDVGVVDDAVVVVVGVAAAAPRELEEEAEIDSYSKSIFGGRELFWAQVFLRGKETSFAGVGILERLGALLGQSETTCCKFS